VADLAFVALLTTLAAGLGDRLLSLAGEGRRSKRDLDRLAKTVPLGLGTIALAILGLGLIGRLNPAGLGVLSILAALVGLGPGLAIVGATVRVVFRKFSRGLRRGDSFDRILLLLSALLMTGTALTLPTPVTDGDALCYHLQVPKLFLENGAVGFEPDLHETVYPLITELLYALALAFRGPTACRGVQWLFGLILAANVAAIARPSLGRRAWWAGVIALFVPAISNGMTAPLNDVSLAALGVAAVAAWLRLIDRPIAGAAAIAGISMGLAIGVKYPALVLFGLLAAILPVSLWRTLGRDRGVESPRKRGARSRRVATLTLVYLASTALVGGVWHARAYGHTGNPVFPYFRGIFGAGLDVVLDPTRRAMAVTPWNLLTALVPMTLNPDRFESVSHQVGPVFLLVLPALILERAPRRVLGVTALGYLFLTICVSQRQSPRFVLSAFGLMSIGVAYVASRWSRRRTVPARLALGVLALLLGLETFQGVARCRHGLGVALGRESAAAFLERREPTVRVGRWIETHLSADARLIGQEHRGYYLPRPYTMELAHRRRTGLAQPGSRPQEVVDTLRREGFTHLLLCPPVPETAVEFDPTLSRILRPWLASRQPIYREDLADADGVVRRYAIYPLAEVATAQSSATIHRDENQPGHERRLAGLPPQPEVSR
jgi:hypothetical protein